MCFGGDDPQPVVPEAPAETLDQAAPEKKTENRKDSNALSIGSKKYATPAQTATSSYPTVAN